MNILKRILLRVNKRITPENITELKPNEVFVFGSNTRGLHGGGAAAAAVKWGAIMGNGFGRQGQTYAIPTLCFPVTRQGMEAIPTPHIKTHINIFIDHAKRFPKEIFLVTRIGTGIAGMPIEEIAPLFENAIEIKNIYLPQEFWDILKKNKLR